MRILVIQHDADKGLGLFVRAARRGVARARRPFAGHDELELADHAAVIALPGVANPDEETLAVTATRAVLREALRQGAADPRHLPRRGAAGRGGRRRDRARARPSGASARSSLAPAAATTTCSAPCPARFDVFQAHDFGFELPPDAVALAAFAGRAAGLPRRRHAWGVQFHPEPTLAMLDGWTRALGHLMQANGVDPDGARAASARRYVPEWSERSPRPWGGASRPSCARRRPRATAARGAGAGRSRRGRRAAGAGA